MQNQIKSDLKAAYNKYASQRDKNEMKSWKVQPRQAFLDLINNEGKKTLFSEQVMEEIVYSLKKIILL